MNDLNAQDHFSLIQLFLHDSSLAFHVFFYHQRTPIDIIAAVPTENFIWSRFVVAFIFERACEVKGHTVRSHHVRFYLRPRIGGVGRVRRVGWIGWIGGVRWIGGVGWIGWVGWIFWRYIGSWIWLGVGVGIGIARVSASGRKSLQMEGGCNGEEGNRKQQKRSSHGFRYVYNVQKYRTFKLLCVKSNKQSSTITDSVKVYKFHSLVFMADDETIRPGQHNYKGMALSGIS